MFIALLLVPMVNAETKYFVCEDIPNTNFKIFNNLLQVNIKEKWIQFDDIRSHSEFFNDNSTKEITGSLYGWESDGKISIKWEFKFNTVTGAFEFTQRELQSPFSRSVLYYECRPSEPLLP